jgi:hypothetical protein
MNENCNYNKTRLLSDMSSIIWRVEKYYLSDAEKAKHPLCAAACKDLVADLKKHKEKMRAAIEGLSKEGKFH